MREKEQKLQQVSAPDAEIYRAQFHEVFSSPIVHPPRR